MIRKRHLATARKISELVLMFGLLFVVDHTWLAGDAFASISPNPLWAPVIAVSVAYGTTYGLAAAALASAIWIHAPHDFAPTIDQISRQLRLSIFPICWFFAALVIGEVTESRAARLEKARSRYKALQAQSGKIGTAFNRLVKINRELQVRIAVSRHTAGDAVTAAADLLASRREDKLKAVAKLLSLAMDTGDFTCFRIEGTQLLPVLSGPTAKRLTPVTDIPDWAHAMMAGTKVLHEGQEQGRKLLEEWGVAAFPVPDPDNHSVWAMLLIHSAPVRFTPGKIAELAQAATAIGQYQDLLTAPAIIHLVESESDDVLVA